MNNDNLYIIENLKNNIKFLSSIESRNYLSEGNKKAEEYISSKLREIGYKVEKDSFIYKEKEYFNLIAKINNKSSKTYMLTAHYDSTSKDEKAPGADDNVSGVAAILELARVLKDGNLPINLEFVFFNLEEEGAIGSEHLAKNYKEKNVDLEGVINLDTIGTWDGEISKEYPLTYVTNEDSKDFMETILKNANIALEQCKDMWTDDHGSFWKQGYKAIELTELGVTKYMHTEEDTYEKLNYDNLCKIINGLSEFFKCFEK